MKTSSKTATENPQIDQILAKKNSKISFSSFQRLVETNSLMRKQVRDLVDLALFDAALKQNNAIIDSIRQKAESETIRIMMHFTKGVSHYMLFSKIIHRNRIIKTLANLNMNDHQQMLERISSRLAV
jgi:hypothetical protein